MGIRGLKKLVPSTKLKDFGTGFGGHTFRIDAANLVMNCALAHSVNFVQGDFVPSLRRFQRRVQFFKSRGMKLLMIFDGKHDPEKAFEYARREKKRQAARTNAASIEAAEGHISHQGTSALVTIPAVFIGLCCKVCSVVGVPFVVAPFQADAMLGGLDREGPSVTVSADTDTLALGVTRWISPCDWDTGVANFVDWAEFVHTDTKIFPLIFHVNAHGVSIFRLCAAVLGCDVTENESGIKGIGTAGLLAALDLHGSEQTLTPNSIADEAIIIVSKQRASLKKDESTRKDTAEGEKPLPGEYTSYLELHTKPTTLDDDGHTLGVVRGVGRSWCPCCAGRASCVHLGMALWAQIHQWGPDRPTDKPSTSALCAWIDGPKKRSADVSAGLGGQAFGHIDMTRPEKSYRACHEVKPNGARFEVLSPADRELFDQQMNPERMRALCEAIKRRT
jgi:5'-3' exonuclease